MSGPGCTWREGPLCHHLGLCKVVSTEAEGMKGSEMPKAGRRGQDPVEVGWQELVPH